MYHLSELPDDLTSEWILSKLRQEDIYTHYLGFVPDIGYHYTNPLRNDNNPGCSFIWYNNILFFRDFALGKTYTCFTIVRDKYGLSYGAALRKISSDLILGRPHTLSNNLPQRVNEVNEKVTRLIQVTLQAWTSTDTAYWKSYHLSTSILKQYEVYSIKHAWVDGDLIYTYSANDPCVGYYFGNNIWKLYFYKRKTFRFISNTNANILQGEKQLKPDSRLIITKSMKDVMCYRLFDLNAIAPQSECEINKSIMDSLIAQYSEIILNYDNDSHGLRAANGILCSYPQIKLFQIPPASAHKDLSDYLKNEGITNTLNLLQEYEICSKRD